MRDRGYNILLVILVTVVVVVVEVVYVVVCLNSSKHLQLQEFTGEFGSPGLDLYFSHKVPVILFVVVTV